MDGDEVVSGVALLIGVAGLLSWTLGDRTALGRELVLRGGRAWVCCRWFGLGLWGSSLALGRFGGMGIAVAALAGGVLLLVGGGRRRKAES